MAYKTKITLVYIYGSYRKIKSGVQLFWPLCRLDDRKCLSQCQVTAGFMSQTVRHGPCKTVTVWYSDPTIHKQPDQVTDRSQEKWMDIVNVNEEETVSASSR